MAHRRAAFVLCNADSGSRSVERDIPARPMPGKRDIESIKATPARNFTISDLPSSRDDLRAAPFSVARSRVLSLLTHAPHSPPRFPVARINTRVIARANLIKVTKSDPGKSRNIALSGYRVRSARARFAFLSVLPKYLDEPRGSRNFKRINATM